MEQLWACELEHLRTYCDRVLCASEETEKNAAIAYESRKEEGILSIDGDTAEIQIRGTLSNRRSVIGWFLGYGSTTYTDILEAIQTVEQDEMVRTVRLVIDSPGGNVAGLDDVWIALRNLSAKKTIVAENHGMMASAAYWIATAAGRIIATSPAAETGSIGVYMVTYDWTEYDKKYGVKEIRIVSKNAPNKVPDPATPEGLGVYQERLNAIERVFISRVAEGRGVENEFVEKNFGRGALLISEDPDKLKISALSVGMIDEVYGPESKKIFQIVDGISEAVEKNNCNDSLDCPTGEAVGRIEKTEGSKMSKKLAELMAEDAALKTEAEALENAAYQRGKEESSARFNAASPILTGEYPPHIKAIAVNVLKGEAEPAELKGAVEVYDATAEERKAAEAQRETEQAGATPPESPQVGEQDGVIRTEEDHQAQVARFRAAQGQEVK